MPRYHVYLSQEVTFSVTLDADNEAEAKTQALAGDYNAEDESERVGTSSIEFISLDLA